MRPHCTTVRFYNPWKHQDQDYAETIVQVANVRKPRKEEYVEDEAGADEVKKLGMNNPDGIQWFPFPQSFVRREATVKPDLLLEFQLLKSMGDRVLLKPEEIPVGPPGKPCRFIMAEIELNVYRDQKALLPAKPWRIPVLNHDKELSEADQRYALEFGIEELLQDCAEYLLDARPLEPQLALANFLFQAFESDRLTEEIEKERIGDTEEADVDTLMLEYHEEMARLDQGKFLPH
ncbi:unnamed protein product [Amoebophrya sp. A120]|nr:unnamed protein product [Amoebophrya sp. A120]|eukprot:GSA120T00005729001.1